MTGPAFAPLMTAAARRAADSRERPNEESWEDPLVAWPTRVNAPWPLSCILLLIRSKPFWASDPGIENRLVSRLARPDDAVPPSTNATTQPSRIFLRWRMTARVQRATARIVETIASEPE